MVPSSDPSYISYPVPSHNPVPARNRTCRHVITTVFVSDRVTISSLIGPCARFLRVILESSPAFLTISIFLFPLPQIKIKINYTKIRRAEFSPRSMATRSRFTAISFSFFLIGAATALISSETFSPSSAPKAISVRKP